MYYHNKYYTINKKERISVDDEIPFDIPNVEFTHYKEQSTFDYIVKKYEIKEDALKSDIIAFYQSAVQSEINTLSKDEIIKTTYAQIMRPRYIETIVSISIVAIIFLLVIPFLFNLILYNSSTNVTITIVPPTES